MIRLQFAARGHQIALNEASASPLRQLTRCKVRMRRGHVTCRELFMV
jgi:hypothetical protein